MKLTFNLHRWPEEKPEKSGEYLVIDHYPHEKFSENLTPYISVVNYSAVHKAWNVLDYWKDATGAMDITLWAELPTIGDVKKLCASSQE